MQLAHSSIFNMKAALLGVFLAALFLALAGAECPTEFAVTFTASKPRARSLGLGLSGSLQVESYVPTDYDAVSSGDAGGEFAIQHLDLYLYLCLHLASIFDES